MKVMTHHQWFDNDIEYVSWEGHRNNREIGLFDSNDGAILINKEDVIALAKEFNLFVFEEDSKL